MLKDFKAFLLRGNVVDLAVGIVIGVAFGAVVTAFVADLITPIIAAIIGKPDFSRLFFTINDSKFHYGAFLNAVISFVAIAAAVFFFVVKPVNALTARARREPPADPTTKKCPECLSEIPVDARRCAFCTSEAEDGERRGKEDHRVHGADLQPAAHRGPLHREAEQVGEREPAVRRQVAMDRVEALEVIEDLARDREDDRRDGRARRGVRERGEEDTDRGHAGDREEHVERGREDPEQRVGNRERGAGERREHAEAEEQAAGREPADDHPQQERPEQRHRRRVLGQHEPRPRDRPDQQIAERSSLRLPRDRLSGEQAGRERKEERLDHRETGERREQPVPHDLEEERRRVSTLLRGRRELHRHGDQHRDAAERRREEERSPAAARLRELNPEHRHPPRARGTRPRACRAPARAH